MYQSISCESHSIYELAIMRNQSNEVTIDGGAQTIQPKDIVAKAGKEYLIFVGEGGTQQALRADYIIQPPV